MEELEITSWLTLDAIKKEAEIVQTVGDLQSGHYESLFCIIEDDFLELCYSDTASNYIRRYEEKEEFEQALEKRREELGESSYDEADHEESLEDVDLEDEDETEEDSEKF